MLHEGNEDQEKYGKQGWPIARRCIAVAMDQGGSAKIGRQIFPDFVQVQTTNFIIHKNDIKLLNLTNNTHKLPPPSCNMRARIKVHEG